MLEIFITLRSRGGLTSYNKNKRVNFAGKKKKKMNRSGVSTFLEYVRKSLSQISYSYLC